MQPQSRPTALMQVLGGGVLVIAFFVYLVWRPAWASWLPAAAMPWMPWALHGVAFLALMGGLSLVASGWHLLTSPRRNSGCEE